jgi:hypothetical protein
MMEYVVYDTSFVALFQFLTLPYSSISPTFRVRINKLFAIRLFIERIEHTDRVRNRLVLLQEVVNMSSGLLSA